MSQVQAQFKALGSYVGFNGDDLSDLQSGDVVQLHGLSDDFMVEFVGWTGEVALPRERGAVARVAFNSGYTDTRVAGELSKAVA